LGWEGGESMVRWGGASARGRCFGREGDLVVGRWVVLVPGVVFGEGGGGETW
jgi:hypothetical protein